MFDCTHHKSHTYIIYVRTEFLNIQFFTLTVTLFCLVKTSVSTKRQPDLLQRAGPWD